MVLGKSDSKREKARPAFSLAHPPQQRILREVWRLGWLAVAVQMALSLGSYSPTDPSWSTWSSQARFQNWMGRAGSIEADLLLQLFGLPAFALALMVGWFALRRAPKELRGERKSPLVGLGFLVALCAVAQGWFPASSLPWKLSQGGGLVGKLVQGGLQYALGGFGATAAAVLILVCFTILLFDLPLLTWAGEALVSAWRLLKQVKLPKPELAMAGAAPASEPVIPVLSAPKLALPEPVSARLPDGDDDESAPPVLATGEGRKPNVSFLEPYAPRKANPPPPPKPVSRDPNRRYELPPVSLLQRKPEKNAKPIDRNWFLEKGQILVEKLQDFGVEGEIVNISPGPVITVYEFKPASGVKIKDIANLSDDLTLALSVLSVRIVAPIPGKPVVGIEIPSPEKQMVHFRDLLEETPFYDAKIRIPILLGRLASGEPVVADLSSMPHLLVAGATGTGKSVFINSLITSLLYRYTPNELRLILVDPKMVELSTYEGIPHLLLPVVVDSKKAVQALRWAVDEMERRYSLLHEEGVRHIHAYNERVQREQMNGREDDEEPREPLPFIVVIIDEYADLMAVVPKEVELSITRLAQKARAAGIHLVLATQRPSTDVVTGLIKANFPSRISFRVASSVDSKTILDRTGAERLLGNGDMLLHSAGFTMLKRMQGSFISDEDTEKVVDFLKTQGEPEYDELILRNVESGDLPSDGGGDGEGDEGKLYDMAVRLVTEKGEASISLIQRHLKIGYNRAATLMEELEREGVVAPAQGAGKRRAVLAGSL